MKLEKYARIDLHLHLDGSLSLASVKELAAMQKINIPKEDEKILNLLQVGPDCRDLNEYLEKFEFPLSLLQTAGAIEKAVCNLQTELSEQGLLYGEIRFAPQLHTRKGLTQSDVVEAAIAGRKKSPFCCELILCCMRGEHKEKANRETVRVAKKYLNQGVCAIDLAGAEALYPTEDYREIFAFAKELGVPYTIHAGEAAGPASVYQALESGADRIGHGVRSVEDARLLKLLSQKEVPLELCPSSNLNTNIYKHIKEYPLRRLMDAGVCVTVNTDNSMVSNTSLKKEYEMLVQAFDLSEQELWKLVMNSVRVSFAKKDTKMWLKEQIEKGVMDEREQMHCSSFGKRTK